MQQSVELFNSEKYSEAIQKLKEVLNSTNDLQQQVDTHFLLGRCYLQQALQTDNAALFDEACKCFQEYLAQTEKLKGEEDIEQQANALFWLGRCYLEWALHTNDTPLFGKAHGYFQKWLEWAEKLNGDMGIEEQAYARFWLGYCYFEQAFQTNDTLLFGKARGYFRKWLEWAEELNNNTGIEGQINAQIWLGRCYFEQALQTGNAALFNKAIWHFEQQLTLAEKLDGDKGIEEQADAQVWLGRCYLKNNKQNKGNIKQSEDFLSRAKEHFDEASKLAEKIKDESSKKQMLTKLVRNFRELDFVKGNYEGYFKSKQEHIQQKLSKNKKINGRLKENIAAVLAVLSIDPIEFDKPLAHYTSPAVCEKLLGIGQKESKQENIVAGKMRMNSSAYMNDPYEGKSLYDLLGIQEPDLENLSELSRHNAFFACFSSRVNDLNQFRLYGKVGNVEASGCCLVLNRRGNWIREPDLEASFHRLNDQDGFTGSVVKETTAQRPSENLPLYQIAYIFYRDEYTQDKEYDVMDGKTDFGIRLKPISDNLDWHEVRKQQLQTALKGLCGYWKDTDQSKEEFQENKAALEYIRYLFKDHAFRDEEEFRLLQIEEIGSDKVQYCPDTNTAFLEYGNVCTRLDEVILGTNYERTNAGLKVEVFRHLLKRKQPHIKVRHSSLPINPPNRY